MSKRLLLTDDMIQFCRNWTQHADLDGLPSEQRLIAASFAIYRAENPSTFGRLAESVAPCLSDIKTVRDAVFDLEEKGILKVIPCEAHELIEPSKPASVPSAEPVFAEAG